MSQIPPPPPPEPEYSVKQIVHYRGDPIPERRWEIKNIGDQFITIQTDNAEGLDKSDTIKVVSPIDIYKEGDYPYTSPYIDSNANTLKTFSQPTQERIKMEERPTINFAPNIIINNDKKEEPVENAKIEEKQEKQEQSKNSSGGGIGDLFGGLIIKKT